MNEIDFIVTKEIEDYMFHNFNIEVSQSQYDALDFNDKIMFRDFLKVIIDKGIDVDCSVLQKLLTLIAKATTETTYDISSDNTNDPVNHPSHYTQGRVETIDYIEDCLGIDGLKYYCLGNAIKYLSRAQYKENELQDIKKAKWYIDKTISIMERD